MKLAERLIKNRDNMRSSQALTLIACERIETCIQIAMNKGAIKGTVHWPEDMISSFTLSEQEKLNSIAQRILEDEGFDTKIVEDVTKQGNALIEDNYGEMINTSYLCVEFKARQ